MAEIKSIRNAICRGFYREAWGKFSLVYYRGNTIDTDIHDLRPGNKIFGIYGYDGTLHLHFASTKSTFRYLVDSETPARLAEIRNLVFRRNRATWANTDTRLCHAGFLKKDSVWEIAIRGMRRGDSIKDFLEYSEMVSGGAM